MSAKVLNALKSKLGDRVVETNDFRGDEEATVALNDWVEAATFLRDETAMDHFIDLTAVDYPEREMEGQPRFDVVLMVRSSETNARIRLRTLAKDGQKVPTMSRVWSGANWAEREVWDMFGIPFDGHKDLRRILLYEEFEGHPLRKDYAASRTQPLVPYRDAPNIEKLPPFGPGEGMSFGRQTHARGLDDEE